MTTVLIKLMTTGKCFSVPADTIDNYLGEHKKVDFIKMDIQGAEVFALRRNEWKTLDSNPDIKILSRNRAFRIKIIRIIGG